MRHLVSIFKAWLGALALVAVLFGIPRLGFPAASSQEEPESEAQDFPKAPMKVRAGTDGGFDLLVCVSGDENEERGPWIESVTVVDLGVEPPAVVWEIVLPKEKRDEAWGWDPKTPWTVRFGKAPPGFRETAALKKPLESDNLYQVSLLGWDPGEMVFAVEPKTKKITYYDEDGKVLSEPDLPCAK